MASALLVVLMGLCLVVPREAWPHNRLGEPIPSNCIVRIDLVQKSGEKVRHQFKTHLESSKECAMLAKLHQPNFDPSGTTKKRVVYRWVK